jgi:PH (Pleckstrin Homology) domain-containing protein
MRLAPVTDTVPRGVNRYLLPDERQVITIHQHPSVLVPPFAAAAGGVFAAIAASKIPGDTGTPELVVWILVIFLILKFILNAISWPGQYIVITGERFIQITGFFVRRVKDMPLTNLDEMTFQRSAAGRILGYGTFRIGPESDGQQVIDYIPYPEQVYLEVKGILERYKG